jgi:transposase
VPITQDDVQVAAKPRRRSFRAEYKRRILREADAWATPSAVGALLPREGLYSSHLVVWRRARARGELAALTPEEAGAEGQAGGLAGPADRRPRAPGGPVDRTRGAGGGALVELQKK